jgi:hypothetical protein
VLQQLSGINGILFYASSIFKAAGKLCTCSLPVSHDYWPLKTTNHKHHCVPSHLSIPDKTMKIDIRK